MDTPTATMFALHIFPIVYVGLALALLGIALIAAEFHLPAFGLLGLLGLMAIVVSYFVLLHANAPGLNVGLPIIAAIGVVGALLVPIAVYMAIRSRRKPVATGEPAMIGATVEVAEDFSRGRGRVRYGGELWNAHSTAPLRAGETARIVEISGLELTIAPV